MLDWDEVEARAIPGESGEGFGAGCRLTIKATGQWAEHTTSTAYAWNKHHAMRKLRDYLSAVTAAQGDATDG